MEIMEIYFPGNVRQTSKFDILFYNHIAISGFSRPNFRSLGLTHASESISKYVVVSSASIDFSKSFMTCNIKFWVVQGIIL